MAGSGADGRGPTPGVCTRYIAKIKLNVNPLAERSLISRDGYRHRHALCRNLGLGRAPSSLPLRIESPLEVALKFTAFARRSGGKVESLQRIAAPSVMPALVAALLVGSAVPAYSAVGIDVEIAPPAPRVVEVPPPRAGFVWAPGYYRWDGHQHVWVDGRWIRERRGSHWVPEHWVAFRGRWHFEPGHWERG